MGSIQDDLPAVEALTKRLRFDSDPFFEQLRALLLERGIDPQHTAMVDTFRDGLNYEFCVVVPANGPLTRFGYSYPKGELGGGVIVDWDDEHDPYTDPADVDAARRIAIRGDL